MAVSPYMGEPAYSDRAYLPNPKISPGGQTCARPIASGSRVLEGAQRDFLGTDSAQVSQPRTRPSPRRTDQKARIATNALHSIQLPVVVSGDRSRSTGQLGGKLDLVVRGTNGTKTCPRDTAVVRKREAIRAGVRHGGSRASMMLASHVSAAESNSFMFVVSSQIAQPIPAFSHSF